VLVALGRFIDRKGIFAVGTGRGVPRRVGGHCPDDNAARRTSRRLSPFNVRHGTSGEYNREPARPL
jgi:hypothetical protein